MTPPTIPSDNLVISIPSTSSWLDKILLKGEWESYLPVPSLSISTSTSPDVGVAFRSLVVV